MQKSLLLAGSNIRKAKSQTAVIFVLIFLASIMLNLWLMLSTDYKQNFARYHKKLNAEHVTFSVNEQGSEFETYAASVFDSDKRTAEYEMNHVFLTTASFKYNGGEICANSVLLSESDALAKKTGMIEITEKGSCKSGIYLPLIYKSEDIDVDKKIDITLGNEQNQYTVCGFINSIMLGSQNCVMTEIIFTDDIYEEVGDKTAADRGTLCSVRLNDIDDCVDYETDISSEISAEYPNAYISTNSYPVIENSRYISQSICSGVISAMAFLTILIAVVVIMSNISNFIHNNMKNLGALKALGFTSRQLIGTLFTQFLSVTLISAVFGTVISYIAFSPLNSMMTAQTGIPYHTHIMPLQSAVSVIILFAAVALAVIMSAGKLRKIEPITALRSGVRTHSFKKNHIPLDKTSIPLNAAMALKTTFANVKQNIVVVVTMLIISLITVFSAVMYSNVVSDPKSMIDLIVGESSEGFVSIDSSVSAEFSKMMEEDSRVENAYLFTTADVVHKGGEKLFAVVYDNSEDLKNQNIVYEGRYPKYENEVAVGGLYAREKKLEIGDEITLMSGSAEENYIITGYTQVSNNLGKDCMLTGEAYERLSALNVHNYYLDIKNSDDIDTVLDDITAEFGSRVYTVLNQKSVLDASIKVYVSLIKVIVAAVIVLTVLIIAFVLYLLVKTLLNNKYQDYGIMKSLGFTSRQLIVQTALSFMPTIIISAAIGITAGCFVINPLITLFIGGIGIIKCTFTVPYAICAAAGVFIAAVSFSIAYLLSARVKKIAPRELLVSE